jgi:chemotaxis protein methyltransferase CheR
VSGNGVGRPDEQTESLELELLLSGIAQRYGYDFSGYSRTVLAGRIRRVLFEEGLPTISALQERLLHEPPAIERFLERVTGQATSVFQNPDQSLALRREVMPLLRTYPFVRIWHVGCGTGEEVYATAIVLHEEGLYPRAHVYGTDVSEVHLERARSATFSRAAMQDDAEAARRAGCREDLSRYYRVEGERAVILPELRRNVIFSQYSLVSDDAFNEFQLIVCRNVLRAFDQRLRDRAHEVLYRSLCNFGVLAMGSRESLEGTPFQDRYQSLGSGLGLYRRIR